MDVTAKKIRELRKKKNLSQLELANAVGVTHGQISAIETGRSDGSREVIDKIIEFLGGESEIRPKYRRIIREESNENSNQESNSNIIANKTEEFLEFLKEENKRLWGIIAKLTNDPSFYVGDDQHALQECKVVTLGLVELRPVA